MAAFETSGDIALDRDRRPPAARDVGRRRWLPKLAAHGQRTWHRLRYPLTRRTLLLVRTDYNPRTLAAEKTIVDKRPLYWLAGLAVLAVAPLFGSSALLSAAAVFAIYAAINVVWMLVIGTAGIYSLATLAVVGTAAYGTAWLSIAHGLPWWGMIAVGPLFGLAFGVVIALPAIRLEGFYYALLTVGLAEVCRVYVVQSRALGSATGGLYGADSYLPDGTPERIGLIISYFAAFTVMLLALGLYRLVNGQRLGRLLRAAPEKHEAFAEALGINFRAARIQVFLISSAALGFIGGFYATYFKGASPSLFSMDSLLLLLAMIVIGGIGRTEGAVVGTLIVVLFDRVLIGLGPLRLICIGAIMLGTVLFLRGGLFEIPAQFRAWREKKKSERRALIDPRGGETMPEEASEIRDKQQIYLRRFDKIVRDRLKGLVTEELIEAHRRNPAGPHSDPLERVLNYFRRAAVTDKYAILAERPFEAYRVVALSGRRGVAPRIVDDRVYKSVAEAQHAVFLRRVHDLMES
jgi:branched-chain amino acid transport system permease protein